MFEYDEYTERILDFTPDRHSGKCHCCDTKIYKGETIVTYDGLWFCDVSCLIKQLASDEVIELDYEVVEEEENE